MSYGYKVIGLSLLLYHAGIAAQICQESSIHATTPTSQFTFHGNGTVTDNKIGLMWKQCIEGQSGSDCMAGSATTFGWDLALQQVATLNAGGGFAGYSDWRVPNNKELLSIVEEQCREPALNLVIFPNDPGSAVWSSSASAYNPSYAWAVNFNYGYNNYRYRNEYLLLRLVRSE